MYKRLIIAILLIVLIFLSCSNSVSIYERTELMMDTIVTIKIYGNRIKCKRVLKNVFSFMKQKQKLVDNYDSESEISAINGNNNPVEFKKISSELYYLLDKAVKYSEFSDGLFDITIGKIIGLWKKAAKNKTLPDDNEIKNMMDYCGYKNLILKNGNVKFKTRGIEIDIGGIAKGYLIDIAAEFLLDNGIKRGFINAGGDIYVLGEKKSGKWRIGIQHPYKENLVIGSVAIKDKAIATSGNYARYFLYNGERYTHIIDPRTGYPIKEVASATVITDKAIDADAMATILMIMGREGIRILNKMNNYDAMIILKNSNNIQYVYTDGFKEKFEFRDNRN